MPNEVTKIIIRRGLDVQRRTANTTGVTFDLSEPAYCVDTKRLFIGDGVTVGGIPVGTRNLGPVTQLFGTDINGYTFEAYNILTTRGAEAGDIIYDRSTRQIYALTAKNFFPPLTSNFVKFDVSTVINNVQFYYDNNLSLNLKDGGVTVSKLNQNVADNITLQKDDMASPLRIATGNLVNGIDTIHFKLQPGNSLLANASNNYNYPVNVFCNNNQIIGKLSNTSLTAINITDILSQAGYGGTNGIQINKNGSNVTIGLSGNLFTVTPTSLTINGSVNTGNLNAGNVGCGAIGCGSINSGSINSSGSIAANGNITTTGAVLAQGDVVAYNTSDITLKDNLIKIKNPINKLKELNGYEFTWNKNSPEYLHGKDVGLVADEVEKIFPNAVVNRNGIKAVNYIKVIPLLVETIKELSNKVEKLENGL